MTAPPLRWALLGASGIAAGRVIPAMRELKHDPVVVLSQSYERGAEFAAANGIPAHSTSATEVVGRPDIDAVYISTTNDRHRELAELAAAAGKHVLTEKPMADTIEDAEAVVHACRLARVVLAVNHQLPGAGTHLAIRRLVRDGAIGEVLGARIAHTGLLPEQYHRWRLGDSPGAGVLLDTATHAASALNAILHPLLPIEVTAMSARQGAWHSLSEDIALGTIRYEGGVLAQTLDAYTMPFAPAGLDVYGSAGSISGIDVLTQDPIGKVLLSDATGTRVIEVADRVDLYERVIERFAAAVAGDGVPTVSGEEGLLATRVALAMRQSAESKAVVALPKAQPMAAG